MPVRTPRRRGFAVLVALVVLSLMSTALLVLGSVLVTEYRRTAQAGPDSQLRQLLLAGAQRADQHLAAGAGPASAATLSVALPPSLTEAGASVSVEIRPTDSGSDVNVVARLKDQELRQTLTYARQASTWTLTAVDLGE